MGKLRQIAQLGREVLRRRAAQVEKIDDPEILRVIEDMLETLADGNGVGIAAPQIYESWRIVVVASRPTVRYPQAPAMEPLVMINPAFEPVSEERGKDWEGCLSIPGIRALVPRWRHISVRYVSRQGEVCRTELTDFIARIFQHEYDHLEGVVYLDRVETTLDIVSQREYFKRIGAG